MTDKELRRLSRRELLQMLLEQTSEVERLQAELDKTRWKAAAISPRRRLRSTTYLRLPSRLPSSTWPMYAA